MDRILVVEDSVEVQTLIKAALEDKYELQFTASVAGSLNAIGPGGPMNNPFDLILLDVMLPDGNGFALCEQIRTQPQLVDVPVVFLTGKGDTSDKLTAFSLGADDYIVKPFDRDELVARVKVRLERSAARSKRQMLKVGGLRFEVALQRVFVDDPENERDVELTPVEFKILYFLASNAGNIYSREQLIQAIWRKDVHVIEENIYTHISMLRKKLGAKATCIESVPRHGYRFNAGIATAHA